MPRPLVVLLIVGVLTAACAGDNGGQDTAADEPAATSSDDDQTPPAPAAPLLAGLDGETADGLGFCADGARDWCEFVGSILDGDQLRELVARCDDGENDACSASANLAAAGYPARDPEEDIVHEEEDQPDAAAPDEGEPDDTYDAPAAGAGQDGGDGAAPGAFAPVELQSDGVYLDAVGQVVFFGEPWDDVVGPALTQALGPPDSDSGTIVTDAGCPTNSPTYRFVDYGGLSFTVFESSQYSDGVEHFAGYVATAPLPGDATVAAFVGDASQVYISPGSTTVFDLRAEFGELVEIGEDEIFGASFRLEDNLGSFFGALDGTDDASLVFSVLAGATCGE